VERPTILKDPPSSPDKTGTTIGPEQGWVYPFPISFAERDVPLWITYENNDFNLPKSLTKKELRRSKAG
jgi:hypothetical protein